MLAGPRPSADADGIIDVIRNIGCLQIDPTSVVAPSQLLVLWSRIGNYDVELLDTLLWRDHVLFENWAHATSILPVEDYPIFSAMMQSWGTGDSERSQQVRSWMKANEVLHQYIITQLRRKGPLSTGDFKDKAVKDWHSTGWTAGRNVRMILFFLWANGKVMVAGRQRGQKLWDLTERILPEWTPRESLSWNEIVYRASQKAIRALGVASPAHIKQYYIRNCYPDLSHVLAELESEGRIVRAKITDSESRRPWPGKWYIHADDLPLLERLAAGDWEPRTTLLSPFDNMISNRKRTEQFFSYKYRFELYVQKPKRRYGAYVMPILHGDRFIGRIDPKMDRKQERVVINAVYAEPDAPMTAEVAQAVADAIEELGAFLGAEEISYSQRVPEGWRGILQ